MSAPDPVCPLCEGELRWMFEFTSAAPTGTGYEILICADCECIVDRRFVGF